MALEKNYAKAHTVKGQKRKGYHAIENPPLFDLAGSETQFLVGKEQKMKCKLMIMTNAGNDEEIIQLVTKLTFFSISFFISTFIF